MTKKSAISSGFEKRKYPSFQGNPLEYFALKKHWKIEVSPELQLESREVFNLKDNLPLAAENKLIDVETLEECWSVLDREYGNSSEIRAKLKQSIASIKLKATTSPHKEIELYEQVQTISAKIRAAGGSEN